MESTASDVYAYAITLWELFHPRTSSIYPNAELLQTLELIKRGELRPMVRSRGRLGQRQAGRQAKGGGRKRRKQEEREAGREGGKKRGRLGGWRAGREK